MVHQLESERLALRLHARRVPGPRRRTHGGGPREGAGLDGRRDACALQAAQQQQLAEQSPRRAVGHHRASSSVVEVPRVHHRGEDRTLAWAGLLAELRLWEEIIRIDLAELVPRLDLPVYFLHGALDYTCSFTLAEDYFL